MAGGAAGAKSQRVQRVQGVQRVQRVQGVQTCRPRRARAARAPVVASRRPAAPSGRPAGRACPRARDRHARATPPYRHPRWCRPPSAPHSAAASASPAAAARCAPATPGGEWRPCAGPRRDARGCSLSHIGLQPMLYRVAATCTASSRVGSMMSAPTWCLRSGSSRRWSSSTSGIRKASVLPEPVHACTATSWWRSSRGMVASCTGVAVWKPCASSASSVATLSGGSEASNRDARESAASGTAVFELRAAATVAPLVVAAADGSLSCGFFLFLKVPKKTFAAGV